MRGARTGPLCPRPPPLPTCPRAGVLSEPVTREALSRVQLNLRIIDPVLPPVRDVDGQVIKFGKVLAPGDRFVKKPVKSVENETVEGLKPQADENFVEGIVANRVDKDVEMLGIVVTPPAVVEGEHAGGHLGDTQGGGDVEASFSSMN